MDIRRKLKTLTHLGMNELDTILIKSLFYPTYIDRVHISFDDVYESFREAVDTDCDSIFEIPFFSSLKKLNKVYGAKFSLYIFEDENLELNESILRDLEQCKDWISIGYHARVDGRVDSRSFYRFNERFSNSGLLSRSCRFHGFSAGDLSNAEIKNSGIDELLCADDGRVSYGVSSEKYSGGCHDGLAYTPTDLRLEKFCSYKVLGIKKKRLIVFAHEQPFQRYHEIKKLEAILRRLPPDVKFDY